MARKVGTCLLFAGSLLLPCSDHLLSSAWAAGEGDSGGWFVPKTSQTKSTKTATSPAPRRHVKQNSAPAQQPDAMDPADDGSDVADGNQAQPVLPLPPIPTPTPVPKGNPPPAVVVGVISVPDVMRQSVAAQEIEKTLLSRRDALQQDVQKEQKAWRFEQQQIQANAKSMTADQIQSRERKLQMRVLKAQRAFRDRNRIIQQAAQVAFGQIERELVQIIQQVAASHGMNLVLHREQIALNVNELDITEQVAKHLNANLPSVFIPPADVDPEELAKSGKMPTTANPTMQEKPNSAANSVVIKKHDTAAEPSK